MDHPPAGPDEFARLTEATAELASALQELASATRSFAALARTLPVSAPQRAGAGSPGLFQHLPADYVIWNVPPLGPPYPTAAARAYLRRRYTAYGRTPAGSDEAPADTTASPVEDDPADPLRSPTAHPNWRTSSDLIRESIIERARWDSWDRARDELDARDRLIAEHFTDDGPPVGDRPAG